MITIALVRLFKNGDEHRRNVLQKILRLGVLKNGGVLLQFVGHLVDDETAAGRERVVGFLLERTFLVDLENAERNAGKNVIAIWDPAPLQLRRQSGRIQIDYVDARIIGELPLEIARECGIEFKEQQLRVGSHPARDRARVHAFARSVLSNHARTFEVDLTRNALNQRFRTGDNGGDLPGALEESLEKQRAHRSRN